MRVDLPFNQVAATIDLTPRREAARIVVDARTDLPDGARVFYYFWHERNDLEWAGGLPPYNVQGYAEVQDGGFTFEADLHEWPAGLVTIWTEFSVYGEEQPYHVVERFGPNGDRLGGPQARWADSGDYKLLYSEATISMPEPPADPG